MRSPTRIEWEGRRVGLCIPNNVLPQRNNIRKVYLRPGELDSGFDAVRLNRKDSDMCVIVLYLYPEPHPPATEV